MSEAVETVQLMSSSERRLTPLQQRRLESLLEVADQLASEGGYAAVNMRAVADKAGVGLATVYRYFASKDHLIAEAGKYRLLGVVDELKPEAPVHSTGIEHVQWLCHKLLEAVHLDRHAASAWLAAITSGDSHASSPSYWEQVSLSALLTRLIGREPNEEHLSVADIIGHIVFSLAIALGSGRMELEEVKQIASRSVKQLL